MIVLHAELVLMSVRYEQFQKVINTASTLKCVQIVELALTHVLQRLSTRLNNSQQRIGFSFAESS